MPRAGGNGDVGGSGGAGWPHILLFLCDQMQYGRQGRVDSTASTPNLDRLADEGVFFTHMHAANGQCVPSRASMQTGLYPHEAGVMIIYGFHGHTARLTGALPTVGHVFRDAGYTTAYFGKAHFGASLECLGYQAGEEVPSAEKHGGLHSATDRAIVDAALACLADHDPASPLFLTVSLHQPHPPFECVETFADRIPRDEIELPRSFTEDDLADKPVFQREHAADTKHGAHDPDLARDELFTYATMIAHVDSLFGEVRAAFERKEMWDDTAAVFTSDHGDMMAAHRMRLKGTLPYDEIFRVPFILKQPATASPPPRHTIDDLAVNVALPGTLIELAGLPLPPAFRGGSLLTTMRRDARSPSETIFFEHYGAYWGLHPFRAIRTRDAQGGEWKLVRYYGPDEGERELYDLAGDPDEIHNRAGDPVLADVQADLERRVDDWWKRTDGRSFAFYESPAFKQSGAAAVMEGTRP
ncbi:MAG: sulfatase-like hydrolase/transferase [Chloroflexia bacterium]|nr:sulfatase-like hydrolase/transferase [Chloroflexia bacterium]